MTNLFSTTLTDRNDIELFEGDYIKFQYVDTMGRLSDELSDEIFVIEFDHGAFIGRSLKKIISQGFCVIILNAEKGNTFRTMVLFMNLLATSSQLNLFVV